MNPGPPVDKRHKLSSLVPNLPATRRRRPPPRRQTSARTPPTRGAATARFKKAAAPPKGQRPAMAWIGFEDAAAAQRYWRTLRANETSDPPFRLDAAYVKARKPRGPPSVTAERSTGRAAALGAVAGRRGRGQRGTAALPKGKPPTISVAAPPSRTGRGSAAGGFAWTFRGDVCGRSGSSRGGAAGEGSSAARPAAGALATRSFCPAVPAALRR